MQTLGNAALPNDTRFLKSLSESNSAWISVPRLQTKCQLIYLNRQVDLHYYERAAISSKFIVSINISCLTLFISTYQKELSKKN